MIYEVDDYFCPNCNSEKIKAITRSGLYYNGYKILKEKQPRISIIENVKALTTKPFKLTFEKILKDLEKAGYNNYYQVLNAKDYGIPQNRERIFIISIRKDIDNGKFEFPKGFDNGIRLKDILLKEVDEKYYINQDKTDKLIEQLKNKNISNGTMFDFSQAKREGQPRIYNDISCTLTSRDYKEPRCVLIDNTNSNNIAIQINKGQLKYKEDDVCSCLDANYYKGLDNHAARTGVIQIDKTLEENKLIKLGNIYPSKGQAGEVYHSNGICPTLVTFTGGGGKQPIILEDKTIQGCSTRTRNYIEQPEQLEIRKDEISNSITTVQKDSMAFEITESSTPTSELVGGIGEINFGKQYRQGNRIYNADTTAMCLLSQPVGNTGGNSYLYLVKDVYYKIRKLTPLECFRLMGFDDQDYYILKDNKISDSQIYKMAGNSIVTNVLYYILVEIYKVMPYLLEDIKLASFFSGIGAFEKAISRLINEFE